MLEPILAQFQQQLYQSVIDTLRGLMTGLGSNGSNTRLQAHSSEFDQVFQVTAQRYSLDPALLKAVAHAESGFAPLAVSHAGAKGVMQLMDATAQHLGVENSFDPVENIEGGARFLRQLLDRYGGDEMLAIAAYNAGPGAVDKWGGLPPYQETLAYVPRVMDLRNQYRGWTA